MNSSLLTFLKLEKKQFTDLKLRLLTANLKRNDCCSDETYGNFATRLCVCHTGFAVWMVLLPHTPISDPIIPVVQGVLLRGVCSGDFDHLKLHSIAARTLGAVYVQLVV